MQVEAVDSRDGRVHAVETHDRVALIFRPDAALEAAFAGLRKRREIENEAADFAEEFAADVVDLVVLAVEAVGIDVNHLQEAFGNIRGRERIRPCARVDSAVELALPLGEHGIVHDALGEIGLAEVVMVANRNRAHPSPASCPGCRFR